MNIVVLCGGLSVERDVSLSSAMQIAQALRNNGHRAVIIDSFFGYTGKYGDPADIFSIFSLEFLKISAIPPVNSDEISEKICGSGS